MRNNEQVINKLEHNNKLLYCHSEGAIATEESHNFLCSLFLFDFDAKRKSGTEKEKHEQQNGTSYQGLCPRTPHKVITRKDDNQVMRGLEQRDVVIPNTEHQNPQFGMTINNSANSKKANKNVKNLFTYSLNNNPLAHLWERDRVRAAFTFKELRLPTTAKFAFTLSEVLITLGIIGIVAAMTIPNLIAKYQQESYVIAWRKAFSTLNQAAKMMQEAEEQPFADDYGDQSDFEYNLAKKFSEYMKTGSICHSNKFVEEGCSPVAYPYYDLGGEKMGDNMGQMGGGASCLTFLNGGVACFDSVIILVDINGYSKPNTVGKDIYYALFDFDNYTLRPAIGYNPLWGATDNVKGPTATVGDGTCQKADRGAGCSKYYLHNMP